MSDTPIPAPRLSDETLRQIREDFHAHPRWSLPYDTTIAVIDELLARRATATTQAARLRDIARGLECCGIDGVPRPDVLREIAATVEGDTK